MIIFKANGHFYDCIVINICALLILDMFIIKLSLYSLTASTPTSSSAPTTETDENKDGKDSALRINIEVIAYVYVIGL